MTGTSTLRLVYEAPASPYKSPDQIAFEQAVVLPNAHTWLGEQKLGYFNEQDLHRALIRRDATSQPFLVSDPMTKLHLNAFEPDINDVKKALERPAFYYALMDVAKTRKVPLPANYRTALESKGGYASIFRQELDAHRLSY